MAQWVNNLPAMQKVHAGDMGLIPGLGRSPGAGNGNPLQQSCLENPMDRGAWQASICWVARVYIIHIYFIHIYYIHIYTYIILQVLFLQIILQFILIY